jgi:glutaredoxin
MITVYGADWCEDTRRSRRLLRRLGIAHQYFNIDEDLGALHRALALTGNHRRTPVIDLGGQISIFDLAHDSRRRDTPDPSPEPAAAVLIEPDNDGLVEALVRRRMLTDDEARQRLGSQNVGDLERVLRTASGAGLVLAASAHQGRGRWPLRIAGGVLALSGLAGWCPAYSLAAVSSVDGPGDRPKETKRAAWLTRAHEATR